MIAADPKQLRIEELEREVRRLRNVLRQCKCGLAAQARAGGVADVEDDDGDHDDKAPVADARAAELPCCVIGGQACAIS